LQQLKLSIYMPINFVHPSKRKKYEDLYDTKHFKQRDRETCLRALLTVNLLKRLESSVHSFRLTLQSLKDRHDETIKKINEYEETGESSSLETAMENMKSLEEGGDTDVSSERIGRYAMESLEAIDSVAYVRFASVYKNFQMVDDFESFVSEIRPSNEDTDGADGQ